jgi:Cys-tRNA(Pro)/Cys-tRNA(Cys) deacylase
MGRKAARGATPATAALTARSIDHTVHTYEHDPTAGSYGLEAAEALGVEAGRVFKTLLVEVDGELVVGVVPVTSQLDLKTLAAAVGGKRATMADPATAERATGYVVGGISPFGQRRRHRTVVDTSALDWPTVHVSGGRRGSEIELAPADLVTATDAATAPLAR